MIYDTYMLTYLPEHHKANPQGYVRVHILQAEKKLGRLLKDRETVHHIDKNKYNNDIDNLMIFKTRGDHTAFHHGTTAVLVDDVYICPDKTVSNNTCRMCGKHKSSVSDMCIKCSKKHGLMAESYLNQRKVDRPNKDELLHLLLNNSLLSIGKQFGVSDNAIRKWCKSYNLPFSKKDIDELKNHNKNASII